jgi:hypothetical protein
VTRIYCHRCRKLTEWTDMRGGRERCAGCRDVFPCRAECGHVDCAERRSQIRDEHARKLGELERAYDLVADAAVHGPGFTPHTEQRLRGLRSRIAALKRATEQAR